MGAWFEHWLSDSTIKKVLADKRPRHEIAIEFDVHPETVARLQRKYNGVRIVKGEVKKINGKRVATTEYTTWQLMKNRCLNPNADDYRYYGGRGITITKSWLLFENFLADMGRKPHPSLTLERKKVNGNYNKRNCVWAPRYVQSRNRTDSRFTEKQAATVRRLYATGRYRQKDIALMYGSTQAAISQIVRNTAWDVRKVGAQ